MEWAGSEFGSAKLGNALRTQRAVAVAAAYAARPAGKVTAVFSAGADREGAFRFVENDSIEAEALMASAHGAAAKRCAEEAFVFVPIDKTSIAVVDHGGDKGFGMVGTSKVQTQGLTVMTGLAVTQEGVPQGILSQQYWARERKTKIGKKKKRRPLEETETQRWLDAMTQAQQHLAIHAPACRAWIQIDREGDATAVLRWAVERGLQITVRAAWDRVVRAEDETARHLWETMDTQPVVGRYQLGVTEATNRRARRAKMEVRAVRVTLMVPHPTSNRTEHRRPLEIGVVLAREAGTTPIGEEPIEWMLLTTRAIDNLEDACLVIYGYTQRWRIEDFHKAWKTGACRVEDSQLRAPDHLVRWAIIAASVAIRIVRMTHLARVQPDLPAQTEFSSTEIRAVTLLVKPRKPPATPTLADMVRWIAMLGGYVGASSGGPPGFLVLARGLARLRPAVEVLFAAEQT